PGLVGEERRPPRRSDNRLAQRWRAVEDGAREALAGSAATLTVLRPAPVPVAGGDDLFSRAFGPGRLVPTPFGYDPPLQLLAADDLIAAVARALAARRTGTYHVAPAAVVPLRKAVKAAGKRRLPLPLRLQRPVRRLLARRGLAAPAEQLPYLAHPSTVSGARIAAELGFRPRATSFEALCELRGTPAAGPPPSYDDFGLDKGYVGRLGRTLFAFLHDVYWRVEWQGLEHVPRRGRAVLAGVHRGFMPWDGVMLMHLIVRQLGRYPRFLIHPALVKPPILAPYMTKLGGLLACRDNAAWVLEREHLLGIFPEGIQGAFSRYRNAYRLRRFGRDDYVKIALRHQAPIVPFVTVGSAEVFPILGKIRWRWWERLSGWPCLPLTPTLGLVPHPSKWHTQFLQPLEVAGRYPPEAAADPAVVRRLSQAVRRRMEKALAEMLRRRRSIFYGSIFTSRPVLEEKVA
ncbi:MAG: hypothetical protein D6696_16225, partial [Acidobacteria bacterium]